MAEAPASLSIETATNKTATTSTPVQRRAFLAAETAIETALAKDLLIQGIKSSRSGDFKRSVILFTQAIEEDSIDPVITLKSYYYRGCALSSLGWYDAAIADFSQVIQFSDRATNITPVAVPTAKLTELYIHRGNAYRQLHHYTHAATDLEQGVIRSGGSAQSYACRGLLRLDIEDFAGAIADFTRALHVHPTFAQCHLWRGFAYLRKGHPYEAADDLSRAIESIPSSPEAYNHRGVANLYLADFSQALSDFNQAIRLNPKFAEAYRNRGILRRLMGDMASAEVDCDRALFLDPQLSQIQSAQSSEQVTPPHTAYEHYQQGLFHLKNNHLTAAIQSFDAAIALSPDYTEPYIDRCIARFHTHNTTAALEDFERIIANIQISHPPRPQTHPHQ